MYHIRFFKIPLLKKKQKTSDYEIHAVLTVSNDLGEIYFYGDLELQVQILSRSSPILDSPFKVIHTSKLKWKPGMRSIPLNLSSFLPKNLTNTSSSVPYSSKSNTRHHTLSKIYLQVYVSVINPENVIDLLIHDNNNNNNNLGTFQHPEFLSLYSLPINLVNDLNKPPDEKLAIRKIPSVSYQKSNILPLHIYEESQESIARHLWDAGLSTVDLFYDQSTHFSSLLLGYLREKAHIFPPKSILELGAGSGYVGLALAKQFPETEVLLTDLEEAKSICEKNISENGFEKSKRVSFQVFDWDEEDVDKIPNKSVLTSKPWDLVLVTDCTYNPSSYSALLKTIKKVMIPGAHLLIAHKYRNDAESEFFSLLEKQMNEIAFDQVLSKNSGSQRIHYVVAI